MLGLPVWGIGPTVGIFGNVADPVASTLAGNFTDSVSRTLLAGTGSLDVGKFINRVAVGTAKDFAFSQLNQTGLPLALGVATQTAAFSSDVYGAFRDVLTPPVPVYVRPPVTPEQVSNIDPETGLQRLEPNPDAIYLRPSQSPRRGDTSSIQRAIYYDVPNAPRGWNIARAGGNVAETSDDTQGWWDWAVDTAFAHSPYRIPLNVVENLYAGLDQPLAGGSTVTADGRYQPPIRGTVIPNMSVVATTDSSHIRDLAFRGRISGAAADEAINDLIQGHTARLYVADRDYGLDDYLHMRSAQFNVDLYHNLAMGAAMAPVEGFVVASTVSQAARAGSFASQQLRNGVRIASRVDLNPEALTSVQSGINPRLLRLREVDAPSRAAGETVLFGQRRVGPTFGTDPRFPKTSGRSIDDVVADLLNPNNPLSADDLPITAFRHPDTGALVSANTRTRAALAKAGLEPTKVNTVDLAKLPARDRIKLLNRLQDTPIIPNAPLPGLRVPVTPSMRDHTVLEIIEIGGKR